ncbi:protein kinase domain-containing protein [Amycolatopsis sp.]|uniref:protein kinase domain-containing protein n=1 Tax=Amycolatopsis sp. TaxID=37632 RepID=UPI002CDFDBFE|nr:AAA family ATPase [Amycolatopsis sp.]HVV11887.1 AAA family ATPase [Amycolatopsis sp.]
MQSTSPATNGLIRTLLKQTDTVETLLVEDPKTGTAVVVKLLDATVVPEAARVRLAQDSALLRRLDLPGVLPPTDVAVADGKVRVVSPYVAGTPLRERLNEGPLSLEEAVNLARQVLASLTGVHAAGLVHRDVRPENVVLDEADGGLASAVVDFGSALATPGSGPDAGPVPTGLRYMAPELAGVLDRPVDGRADLYAVGIMLFECLAGAPPFDGPELRDVLRQHLCTPLPPLRTLGIVVPHAFDKILRRLTHKDPDDRYQSADAALADLVALQDALHRGVGEPEVAVGSRDCRRTVTEPAITGRETELSTLLGALADAGAGTSGMVILEAESGGGKSRVLDELARRATSSGAWVLRGHGVELTAQHPLQMLVGVAAGIQARPDRVPDLVARLGDAVGPLRQALPELADVLPPADIPPPLSEARSRARSVAALVTLLDSLGSAEHPALVALDDCQWADELTLEVLQAWAARAPDEHLGHALVVLAARPGEGATARLVAGLPRARRLALPAMSSQQVQTMIASMAGVVPAPAVKVIDELSRGNPLMVSALVRGLVESGALTPDRAGWRFTPPTDGWRASRGAAAVLAQRLALLTPATRRLLAAGAVLGRTFDLGLAALLAEVTSEADTIVQQAVARHLIWRHPDGRCTFAHDRLRESVLADQDSDVLASLHRRAAQHIEAASSSRAFEIAFHYDAAGAPEHALGYALQSAAAARKRHDLELAERQYRIAERGAREAQAGIRSHVAEALGQILILRGRYDEAAARFEFALSLAEDDLAIARLEGQLGEVLFRTDDLESSVRHSESGLRVLGEHIPAGTVQVALALLGETVRRLSSGGLRRRRSQDPAGPRERDLVRSRLYTQLQYPRWFHSRRLDVLWLMLRQVNVAERCPDNPELAHSYGVWGGAMTVTFPFLAHTGLRYVDRSRDLSRDKHDPRGEGHAASMRTCVLLGSARYTEGARAGARAAELLQQFGDRWEVNFASRNRAVCLYRSGKLREAVEEARAVYRDAAAIGDANAEVTALEVIAKATGGQVTAEQTARALQLRGSDLEVTVGAAVAEALRLRRLGRADDAVACLAEAAAQVGRTWPTSTYLVPVYSWLATLLRELAEGSMLPAARRRALRRARRAVRRALRHARLFPGERPHAYREAALVAALRGRSRRARHYADRCAAVVLEQEAWAELAELRTQCARLELPGPATAGPELPILAGRNLVEPPTVGLAERFASLLESGARLASAASPQAVSDAVRQAATTLLRADLCLVGGLGCAEGDWPWADGAAASDAIRAVIARAAARRGPITMSEPFDADHDIGDGLVLAGVRSLLCAPVLVREEVTGWFLVAHSQVGQLFGEEEKRLAEFIARLAGAASERQLLHRESRLRVIGAQEAERARIARDLHDELGQALTSILLQVRTVEECAAAPNADLGAAVVTHAGELRDLVTAGLHTVRRLAFDLRPTVLDDLGLVAALRRLVTLAMEGSTVVPRLEVVELDGTRLPSDVETTAYRIVQEGLTNVARHSQASECSVVVAREGDVLRVVIEDDGVGFETGGTTATGLGLRGMTERAELLGGVLRVTSAPGEGTTIVFEVPLV